MLQKKKNQTKKSKSFIALQMSSSREAGAGQSRFIKVNDLLSFVYGQGAMSDLAKNPRSACVKNLSGKSDGYEIKLKTESKCHFELKKKLFVIFVPFLFS